MSEALPSLICSESWYNRSQYRPRRESSGEWFLLPELDRDPAKELVDGRTQGLASGVERADSIRETYSGWSLPLSQEAEANLTRLADNETRCVVTGQQPGFLGGPLYTIYKAVSAIAIARELEAQTGRPHVPVFWVAGDDHDYDEIKTFRLGADQTFTLPGQGGRRPLATIPVDEPIEDVLESVRIALKDMRYGERAIELCDLYRGRNLASGFAAVLSELLGRFGLLILDPERVRSLARPIFRRVIDDPVAILAACERGAELVAASGIPPFVRPRLPLFLVEPTDTGSLERHHLTWRDGSLAIDGGGRSLSQGELLTLVDESPERFSPGALLRPFVQEVALGSLVTVGGPAELGYFGQLPPIAESLELETPRSALRFHATLLFGAAAKAWDRLELDVDRFSQSGAPEDLLPAVGESGSLESAAAARSAMDRLQKAVSSDDTLDAGSVRQLSKSIRKMQESAEKVEQRLG
ncbi:MAG: bacillithiol biosynthesis BshC, partial [Planctomycetota bacterium]